MSPGVEVRISYGPAMPANCWPGNGCGLDYWRESPPPRRPPRWGKMRQCVGETR
jgi:hypothetical protein